jgi:hypothetical protein
MPIESIFEKYEGFKNIDYLYLDVLLKDVNLYNKVSFVEWNLIFEQLIKNPDVRVIKVLLKHSRPKIIDSISISKIKDIDIIKIIINDFGKININHLYDAIRTKNLEIFKYIFDEVSKKYGIELINFNNVISFLIEDNCNSMLNYLIVDKKIRIPINNEIWSKIKKKNNQKIAKQILELFSENNSSDYDIIIKDYFETDWDDEEDFSDFVNKFVLESNKF